MGGSASKAARSGAGATSRKYPSRPSPSAPSTNAPSRPPPAAAAHQPGPTVRPQPHASGTRDEAINLDASDPDFARSLRQLGAVQPSPTLSPSSTFAHPSNPNQPSMPQQSGPPPTFPDPRMNPALTVLDARSRIAAAADKEFMEQGRRGFEGRSFVDVGIIRRILALRDERGMGEAEIEKTLELRRGTVGRLGVKGVVGTVP